METRDFYLSLPTKRMAAGALFFNSAGEVLLVKPTYKHTWEIPGGVVEAKESPRNACVREVEEELGLSLKLQRLLCVDYTSPAGERTESLQFLFLGETLDASQIEHISLPPNELCAFSFFPRSDVAEKLGPRLRERIIFALSRLHDGVTYYLEDQTEILSVFEGSNDS